MKIKVYRLCGWLLVAALLVACNQPKLTVKPIVFDLPASFKSDTAAYHFIEREVKTWNEFGKNVETMYHEGEKWLRRDTSKLNDRQLYRMLKLDLDYAKLWFAQEAYKQKMLMEVEHVFNLSTPQGAAKVMESQMLIAGYYLELRTRFGDDLNLNLKSPTLILNDSIKYEMDPAVRERLDSLEKLINK